MKIVNVLLTSLSLLLMACGSSQRPDQIATVRDSAGVRIVENTTAKWNRETVWKLSERPALTIGDEQQGSPVLFTRVAAGRLLPGDAFVIANFSHPPELHFFDPKGVRLSSVGREGEGPGEFQAILTVFYADPDSILVFDPWLGRVSVFSTSGHYAGSVNIDLGQSLATALRGGRFADGTFLARPNAMFPSNARVGTHRDTVPWWRTRIDGSVVDTIGRFPDIDYFVPGNGAPSLTPFGRHTVTLAHGNHLYVGTADRYVIDKYDLSGRLRLSVRREHSRREITRDDIEALQHLELDRTPASAHPQVRRKYQVAPVPTYMPPYDRFVRIDPEGHVWVKEYSSPTDKDTRWSVFDVDGTFFGEVTMPHGFRVLDIGSHLVLGVAKDELDVERVEVYELIRN